MQITEAFKGKTLVITGGTGSFASACPVESVFGENRE